MTNSDIIELLRDALPSQYQVEGYLRSGGQGAVFRASLNGQPIALKVFKPGHDPEFRRLERELELLERIDCVNLVKVVRTDEIVLAGVNTRVVAYEYLGGGDLRQLLEPGHPTVSTETLLQIGFQISNAIRTLWAERIVHRDVKPANIMQREQGAYVLVDLGLARHLDRSDITAPGAAPGTSGYKSPEQARGVRNLTINSDVFSLGVTLYEIAAHEHPFGRNQLRIGVSEPRPLREIRPDLPGAFSRLIHQMMAVVPAQRPANVYAHFVQALGR